MTLQERARGRKGGLGRDGTGQLLITFINSVGSDKIMIIIRTGPGVTTGGPLLLLCKTAWVGVLG